MTTQEKVIPINKKREGEKMAKAIKGKKAPAMLTDADKIIIRQIPIGIIFKDKTFNSFESLRQKTNKIVWQLRNDWLNFILMKNSIYVNYYSDLTRREIIGIYEQNGVTVVNDGNIDRVYKHNMLLGEWSRERNLRFDSSGGMMIEIKYSVT